MTRTLGTLAAALAAWPALMSLPALAASAETSAHTGTVPAATANAPEPATPALWMVADEDTTIYLFGTIHVLPKGISWFDGKVAEAFTGSHTLVTEIADKEDPQRMQTIVADMATLADGGTLRAMLGPEQKVAYEVALGNFGLAVAALDRFEPWYAALTLSTLPLIKEGFLPEHGVEDFLEREAQQRSMAHKGLETAEYQLTLFDSLAADVQTRYLGEVVQQLPTIREELNKMVDAWKRGDADELARLMNAQGSDPVLVETLLVGRNRNWADWVQERLDEPGTVFLAVGAGHLAGPGSLQEQLAARSIATKRIQ